MKWSVYGFLLAGILLNLAAQLGLKAATDATGPLFGGGVDVSKRMVQLLTVPWLWLALACYGISVIAWVVGLSRIPVSQAYPMLSMNYVLMVPLAWWLLGEAPNAQRLAGIVVIIAGVFLVARS
jgi:drug/metabolite transporter (DMT)-like permease